ncbi:MAG: hypothetical protein GC156_00045 [Actinomycetales bacterium]|nr:hypothetical protein [Actinomycetales bacterium]
MAIHRKAFVVTRKMAALAALAGLGVVAASLATAVPATADSSGRTTLNAGNGTAGVNQVLTGTYEYPNGDYPTCWDPRTGVRFDFKLKDGTDLGSVDATCSGTSTWTATMNWTPASSGSYTITAYASEPNFGGSGNPLGQASKKVSITGSKPAPSSAPSKARNLKVTGVSTNAVSLNWDAPSSPGSSPISGYIVKWDGPTSGQIVAPATNANIGTLTAGSAYTFSVAAANAVGWSDWVSVSQRTANAPTPAPVAQQRLVGPMWTGGGPKVTSNMWRTFNNTQNLDTNAGYEARLSATNRSASIKSVSFRYDGDRAQVRAVLKPGQRRGTFTLVEYAPAVPGFTAMSMTRVIKVVK